MRQWSSCHAEHVRLGNIISHGGVTDEVTGKRASGGGGNTMVFLDLRDNASIEVYNEELVEVYR